MAINQSSSAVSSLLLHLTCPRSPALIPPKWDPTNKSTSPSSAATSPDSPSPQAVSKASIPTPSPDSSPLTTPPVTKKTHLTFQIYKSVPTHRDVGAGFALHANALYAIFLLSPKVRRAYLNAAVSVALEEDEEITTEIILTQGPHTGTKVTELGRTKGLKSVSRADLPRELRVLVEEETIS